MADNIDNQVTNNDPKVDTTWQPDFKDEDLVIPYSRDDVKNKETEETSKEIDEEKSKKAQDIEPDYEPETFQTNTATLTDPGEFIPGDYSFDVTLKDGKSVKVTTPEEAEKIADDPDNFETPKQLSEFMRKYMKMERKLDQDREKWESDKKAYEGQLAEEESRVQTVNNMTAEFNYLVGKGMLPPIDPQYLDANWTDPEVAKQPGVKEQLALLDYMVKENKARAKAGVTQITSVIDAYNAWKLEDTTQQEADASRRQTEQRKAIGARVAPSSPASQGVYVPKGIAVGNPNIMRRGAAVWDD